MTRRLHLGISTCPNDTFAFHALLAGEVSDPDLDFEIELLDVEELNRRLALGEFDAAKGSFHAALLAGGELGVLPSGCALGFGNGPLLLSKEPDRVPAQSDRVLCPGEHTTATFLLRLFHPQATPEQVVFSEILPALQAGQAPFGVCIHEGRFTYADQGLHRVEDLGERWEQETGTALPLGGIFARPTLGAETLRSLQAAIAASLDWAHAHPEAALPTMRRHAQELSDEILMAHVDLYVNRWTRDLGRVGQSAIASLAQRGVDAGLLPADTHPLRVLGRPRLFHITDTASAESLMSGSTSLEPPSLEPPSLESEGFIHLSHQQQLQGTLQAHFPGEQPLELLELDGDVVGPHVELESSRGGDLFPHLYRALRRGDVLRHWPLTRAGEGWSLPALGGSDA